MNIDFRNLKTEDMQRAYALARFSGENRAFSVWTSHVRDRGKDTENPSRLMGFYNEAGYLLGLCNLSVRKDRTCGKLLEIEDLFMNDIMVRPLLDELLPNLTRRATHNNCIAVHLILNKKQADESIFKDWLTNHGFTLKNSHWCLKLD